jgi:imidazolonepropionase-like amidohydrolase
MRLLWLARVIAFTHAAVIDPATGKIEPDMTVVVSDDRVAQVAKTATLMLPAGTRIVDASGKYIIPGLWDMHVHGVSNKRTVELFLANGITGVRSMFDDFDAIEDLRNAIKSGAVVGPRIYASGPIVDGPKPVWPGSIAVATAEEGRKAVDNLKKRGVDFIKVYSSLPREAYFAIADEANKQHIPFAGHVPDSVTAAEASDAGQKSVEHLYGVALACSHVSAKRLHSFQEIAEHQVLEGETYDPAKAKTLFDKFIKNGTWQTPTLTALRVNAYWSDPRITQDARSKYIPESLRQSWTNAPLLYRLNSLPPEAGPTQRKAFDMELELVGRMRRAGVRILAGTDTGNPYVLPGFGLHDELQLLVKSGLTTLEALQAATIRPAEFFGIAGAAGSIAEGKFADLVLLNADPLRDIANTQKIDSVVAAGRYFTRDDLDKLLMRN